MGMTIGMIINPVAGMGGSVGLKGTDGKMYQTAVDMGAEPVSPDRVKEFIKHSGKANSLKFLVAPGDMGATLAANADIEFKIVGSITGQSTPEDTRRIAGQMLAAGAELMVFAGGDGTARDIADAIGTEVPVIAIPSGVKIYSPVFANSARAAAELLDAFVDGAETGEEEVLDIDEDAFRDGRMDTQHYGYLLVPLNRQLLQGGKESSVVGMMSDEAKEDFANAIIDEMSPDTLYFLGCGTTLRTITDVLGVEKTLLGIDAVLDGQIVGSDLNEQTILDLLEDYPNAAIIVSPLGGNGFILGRGNKQFTPAVLRRVGVENVIVFANREKLLSLPALHVDTGDVELDKAFYGYAEAIVGPGHRKLMQVK